MRTLTAAHRPSRRLLLLAPASSGAPDLFPGLREDENEYNGLLAQMQRLRGRIYLEDGAISASQLSSDGRHKMSGDLQSWHLLLVDEADRVMGCIRALFHNGLVPLSALKVWSSTLAQCGRWGGQVRKALQGELNHAREEGLKFAEIGGWALAKETRCSAEAARMVLATYSLVQLCGNAIGVSTATARNGSATILKRLGGRSVVVDDCELPPYFDPVYNCDMELLRFDSRSPNPRYTPWVSELKDYLVTTSVITGKSGAAEAGKMFPVALNLDLAQHA